MGQGYDYDAVVVGAGPNGLAAAVALAREGCSVLVLEANDAIGGGARSGALTLPGFVHDLGSSIHPMGVASPFFRSLPLEEHGLSWIEPDLQIAHPLDDGTAAVMHRSIERTAAALGKDEKAYRFIMEPLVSKWEPLIEEILQPLIHVPRHPLLLARFGLLALQSVQGLSRLFFRNEPARALFAGIGAHSILPLESVASGAFGLVLGLLGHAVGWPMPRGGAQQISDALASYLRSLGGEIQTGRRVRSVKDLPSARATLLDVTPRQVLRMAGDRLPARYRAQLEKYRYGPGLFKMDFALDGPIPWTAPECARAGTLHLGGTLDEIAESERSAFRGEVPDRPFVLLAQNSVFDPTRAPEGKHTAWAYCHVPNGSAADMSDQIERQIERFAPGFRDRIIGRSAMKPADLERSNHNLIGGDITGGVADLPQLLARPVLSPAPYRTPVRGLYLCSSSTPPGGGVHGMCGYLAARTAIKDLF